MFTKESWLNSYATVGITWSASTMMTFLVYLKQTFAINLVSYTNLIPQDILVKLSEQTPSNDTIAFLTWFSATLLAIASGWSRWMNNRADTRLKNAEAATLEHGISKHEIEDVENACRQHECFFIDFYTKQKLEDMEEKMREELLEQVRKEFQERNIEYNANAEPTFSTEA